MAASIWKDYYVDLGSDDFADFRILIDSTDEVIYSGRAYIRPGEDDNYLLINNICADYLENVLPTLSQAAFEALTFPLKFRIEMIVDDEWEEVESVEFINDWSYDPSYDPETMGMSFPINGHIDARQLIIYTALDVEEITATITFKDGTSAEITIPLAITADFNDDYNFDFAKSVKSSGSGTAVFDLSEFEDVVEVTIGNSNFQVETDCKEWALYYVNAYGGWDTFLIEGVTTIADNLTRHTMDVEYDNRSIQNRGRRNYANEISKVYTMHTGLLNDSESEMMHHLLNSVEVYLYNINTGEMIPVTLNNTTTEYKRFMANGGLMSTYTIEATLAQDRMRR